MSLIIISIIIGSTTCVSALNNGLAKTPPMGWSSWICNYYNINEQMIKSVADIMHREGYQAKGYEYIIIDDGWQAKERDASGRLQADRTRFSNGIAHLAEYVHRLGLKLGIFSDIGPISGYGAPGSEGHLEIDARTFADWGVDYVKMSGYKAQPSNLSRDYPAFGNYLKATGRNILYATSWPAYQQNFSPVDYRIVSTHCNTWRYYRDMEDNWSVILDIMKYTGERQKSLIEYAGQGSWNDPDVLTIGNGGLNLEQSKTQMVMWSILAAPLLISTDLSRISPDIKNLLQNSDLIAINQDQYGIQGYKVFEQNNIDVWLRPIGPRIESEYSFAVAFVNKSTGWTPIRYSVTPSELELRNVHGYHVTDILGNRIRYDGNIVVKPSEYLDMVINPGGVVLFKLQSTQPSQFKNYYY